MTQTGHWIGIGELARRTGTCPETIRYFEKIGMLPAPARTPGGNRRYSTAHLNALTLVVEARRLGFSPAQARELAQVMEAPGACRKASALAQRHLAGIRERREALQRFEARLDRLLSECSRPRRDDRCPVIESLRRPSEPAGNVPRSAPPRT